MKSEDGKRQWDEQLHVLREGGLTVDEALSRMRTRQVQRPDTWIDMRTGTHTDIRWACIGHHKEALVETVKKVRPGSIRRALHMGGDVDLPRQGSRV